MTADNDSALQPPEPTPLDHAGRAAKSSLDEAMDAVVYDVHPAIVEPDEYIYGVPHSPAEHSFVIRPEDIYRPAPLFSFQPPAPADYKVPQRFGMSAIFGIMTALAILFGAFRTMNAEPVVYLFFGVNSLVICLVQMFSGKWPRAASVVAGAVMAPLFSVRMIEAAGFHMPHEAGERVAMSLVLIPVTAPIGAFLGYLTGTCAAGIFLVMDYLEPYLQGNALASVTPARPTP